MKLSVLIPCYNEINTIEKILDKVLAENKFQKEITPEQKDKFDKGKA